MRLELSVNEAAGMRLDRFVVQVVPELSRTRIQRAIKEGEIRVFGSIERPSYRLRKGDVVTIEINAAEPEEDEVKPENIPLDILYEDKDIVVINKPADLVVHPAPGCSSGTLVNALLYRYPGITIADGTRRAGIVHRLDKDTTGAMVIAKTDEAFDELKRQIKQREVDKHYLTVVYGEMEDDHGVVVAPIGRHPINRTKMTIVDVDRRGRTAITRWRLLETFPGFSYLSVKIETGRTHQIRVHMHHIGHSVLGDPLYGSGRRRPRQIPEKLWEEHIAPVLEEIPGQVLHARRLVFSHPTTGEEMEIEAPLPQAMVRLLEALRRVAEEVRGK